MKRQIAAAAALLLLITGCSPERSSLEPLRFDTTFLGALDTVVRLVAYCPDSAAFDRACERVRAGLERADRLFNLYRGDSALARLNAAAGEGPVPVDAELAARIEECRALQKETAGVNIALGAPLKLWHTARETGEPPSDDALAQAMTHVSMNDVRVEGDEERGYTAEITDPDLSLDMGAAAKGFAADDIADDLREAGFDCFLLDCGASTIVCEGRPPGREGWTVALRNPDASVNRSGVSDPAETLGERILSGQSLGTSGDYQKYFEKNGIFYSHILDPDSGRPADFVRAVTVIAPRAGLADFYSTALYALPYDRARALAERTPNVEALWVLEDGSVQATDGFALRDSA